MPQKIHNIHDKFFKEVLSEKQNAIDFFKCFFPSDLVAQLDLDSLERQADSFTTPHLQEVFSDAVFLCKLAGQKHEAYITILLEHKSTKDDYAIFQLLRYLAEGYALQIKQKKDLRVIVPMLFYKGTEHWELKHISAFFATHPAPILKYLPNFATEWIDLKQVTEQTISELLNIFLATALLMQKYSRNPSQLEEQFERIIHAMANLTNKNFFVTLFVYLIQILDIDEENFKIKIDTLPLSLKENIMSTYDSILEKGIEIGTAKGMEKGMERGIEKGLQKGIETKAIQVVLSAFDQEIPLDLIANITKLPLATVMQILKDNQRL